MKGFAMKEVGKADWVEKPIPECGPMDAICKPLAMAVCTSDIHILYEGAGGPHHDLILGHEATAEVVKVGDMVKDFKPGDRVIIPAVTPDWNSLAAQDGYPMHCGGMLRGCKYSNFKDGVFGEYFHVNDADGNLALLPEGIDPVEGSMLSDMVPTGFTAVELADVQFGDTVLVIGIGPVGLMSVAGCALRGASRIIAVGTRPVCVEAAKGYGATDFISYKEGPIAQQVMAMTDGKGVDKVCIAGGNVDTFAEAVMAVKPGGKIGNVNFVTGEDTIPIPRVAWGMGMSHKQINGGLMLGGRRRMERLASLVTYGRLDLKPLCTHVYNGWDKMPEAFEIMYKKPKDLIKSVVTVNM